MLTTVNKLKNHKKEKEMTVLFKGITLHSREGILSFPAISVGALMHIGKKVLKSENTAVNRGNPS